MICPDCEFEVEKLNKKGVCKRCAQRKADAKYRKVEYIKIKDLKGTNKYEKILKHIKEEQTKKENENKEIIINPKQKAKEVVEKDIENRISVLKLNIDTLNLPLEFVLESFVRLFNKDIIKQKKLLKNEYEVFITDRLHKLMYTEDLDEIQSIGLEQKYVEEKRFNLKKELNLYEPFAEIIDEMLSDEVFITKLEIAMNKYNEIKKSYENPIYKTNTLSMQDLDFTVKSKNEIVERKLAERKPLKRYYASVPCNNLYGNPDKTLFEVNGGIIAENEEIAKQRLKDILKQFNGIFYNDKDIVIKEFSLEKE